MTRPTPTRWRDTLNNLLLFAWPPISAFRHETNPTHARSWWAARAALYVLAFAALVYVLYKERDAYRGYESFH